MFKDEPRHHTADSIREKDLLCFREFLTTRLVLLAATAAGMRIVARPLSIAHLVWLSVSTAFFPQRSFTRMLPMVLRILLDQPGFDQSKVGRQSRQAGKKKKEKLSKHSPFRDDPTTPVSEEAFVQARQRLPEEFWYHLLRLLVEAYEEKHADTLKFKDLRVVDMDGTQLALPNHPAFKKHFGTAKNGSAYQRAQARIVMMHFPFTRLPYRYLLTPLTQGEVTSARVLAKELRANDLLLLDAGFWSYGFFWDVQNQGAFFALRLTQKAKFKTLRNLTRNDKLVRWTPAGGKWKGLPKSMDLRLVTYRIPGYRSQTIVTNLLDAERLSYEDWTRLSWECGTDGRLLPGIYSRRWEIETTFRELKVTQGLEKNIRSRTPKSLQYEVAGNILLYLLVRWLMVEVGKKEKIDPLRLSFKEALHELLEMRTQLIQADAAWAEELLIRLMQRIAKHRVPSRLGRSYPRKKKSSNHRRAKSKRQQRVTRKKTTKA
jgi:DDE family transposase